MFREDGSIKSSNLPTRDQRALVRDYGLYRGVVRDVVYTDSDNNESGGDKGPNEVLYDIMVIGGERDGQIFSNARLIRTLGGWDNFEEITLKKLEGITKSDPTSVLASADLPIKEIAKFNGDVVYFQFINGDPTLPVIIGLGYHQGADPEAEESDGPRFKRKFNGVLTEISKDGEYSWTKSNGAFVPLLPNSANLLYPYVSQFAPIPGQEEALKLTIGNKYDILFETFLGLNVAIDGLADTVAISTTVGTMWSLDGKADSFEVGTAVGTGFKVDGLADSLNLETAAGAVCKIDGLSDKFSVDVAFGDSFSVSAKDGIQASTPTGTSLSMKNGEVALLSGGQATLVLDKTGFIKLGNASGDVLKDVLGMLLQTLSVEAPAGFGAPLVGAATYLQLMTKLKLISG